MFPSLKDKPDIYKQGLVLGSLLLTLKDYLVFKLWIQGREQSQPWFLSHGQSLTQRFHSKTEKMFNYVESLGVNLCPWQADRCTSAPDWDLEQTLHYKRIQRLVCVWEIVWSNKQRTEPNLLLFQIDMKHYIELLLGLKNGKAKRTRSICESFVLFV